MNNFYFCFYFLGAQVKFQGSILVLYMVLMRENMRLSLMLFKGKRFRTLLDLKISMLGHTFVSGDVSPQLKI